MSAIKLVSLCFSLVVVVLDFYLCYRVYKANGGMFNVKKNGTSNTPAFTYLVLGAVFVMNCISAIFDNLFVSVVSVVVALIAVIYMFRLVRSR